MADFNLSAEVILQLAKGTAVELQKQLNNLSFSPDLDPKKVAKTVKGLPIFDLPIKLSLKGEDKKSYSDLFKKQDIAIKLSISPGDAKAFKNKIEKLLNVTAHGLKAAAKTAKDAAKEALAAAAAKKADAPKIDVAKPGVHILKEAEKVKHASEVMEKSLQHVIDQIKKLAAESDKLNGAGKGKGLGTFFQDLNREVEALSTNGVVDIKKLAQQFEGLDGGGTSGKNFVSALKKIRAELLKLGSIEEELARQKNIFGDSLDITGQLKVIDQAKQKIKSLIYTMDAADSSGLSTAISGEMTKVRSSIAGTVNAARKDKDDFVRLMDGFNAAKLEIEKGGVPSASRNKALDTLQAQVDLTNKLRSQGKTTQEIRGNRQFQISEINISDLVTADKTIKNIINNLERSSEKSSIDGLLGFEAAKLTGLEQKTKDIIRKTNDALTQSNKYTNKQDRAGDLIKIGNTGKAELSKLIKDTEKLQGLLNHLDALDSQFGTQNLPQAQAKAQSLRRTIEILARSGASLNTLTRSVDSGRASVLKASEDEKKILRLKFAIDRARDSAKTLDASLDIFGAGNILANLEKSIDSITQLDERSAKSNLNKGLFDFKQAERFNSVVAETKDKLAFLGADENKTDFSAKIFSEAAETFEKDAKRIAASTGTVNQKLRELNDTSKLSVFKAKFDAEGGFLGSIAKAAGLATKRLGAFLIFAQGLYGIQNVITTSFGAAVTLDKEFVKLEQVFNKDLSGSALIKQIEGTAKQVLYLAKTFGVSSIEVAKATKIFAQAGIAGKDLEKIMTTVTKAELGPSFAGIAETAEASIAIMNQFKIKAEDLEGALGGVSRVAAKFPVEAEGITAAVRRAGGAFAATGNSLQDFVGAFTIVKKTTREADETIATSLRNIVIRLQRLDTQKYLKENFDLSLLDDQGRFLGFSESITKVGEKLKQLGVTSKDPAFSQLLEKLAGQRQVTRLQPLLKDYEELNDLNEEFRKGAGSIDEDAVIALQSIENKLVRAKEALVELFTEFVRSKPFKIFIDGLTALAQGLTSIIKSFNSLPGLILGAFAAVNSLGPLKIGLKFFLSEALHGLNKGAATRLGITRKNIGGVIPGRGPNKDSVLAHLTKGEYVVNRDTVDEYGVDFFDRLNKGGIVSRNGGGIIPGFNAGSPGGVTGDGGLQSLLLKAGVNVGKQLLESLVKGFKTEGHGKLLGRFNEKTKQLRVNEKVLGGSQQDNIVSHEFAHALALVLDKSQLTNALKDLPSDLVKSTTDRVKSRPDAYGQAGSKKFNAKLMKELFADAFAQVSSITKGGGQTSGGLKSIQSLAEGAGVTFGSTNSARSPIGTSVVFDAKKEAAGETSSIISRIRGAGSGKGFSGPPRPPGAGFPSGGGTGGGLPPNINKVNGAFAKLLPSVKAAGSSLLSLKGGGALALSAMVLLQQTSADTSRSLAELAASITSAVVTFYSIKQLGGFLGKAGAGLGLGKGATSTIDKIKGSLKLGSNLPSSKSTSAQGILNLKGLGGSKEAVKAAGIAEAARKGVNSLSPAAKAERAGRVAAAVASKGGGVGLLGRGAALLTKNFNVIGIATSVAVGALQHFTGAAEESANKALEVARTEEEALAAVKKKRRAQDVGKVVGVAGRVAAGAGLGAVVGGPIGAVLGGIAALGPEIAGMFKSLAPELYSKVANIFSGIGGFFSTIGDWVSSAFGAVADSIGATMAFLTNTTKERNARIKADEQAAKNVVGLNKAQREVKTAGSGVLFNQDNFKNIAGTAGSGLALSKKAGNFSNLGEDEQARIKSEGEKIKGLLELATPLEQVALLDVAKKSGVDMVAYFKEIGVSYTEMTAISQIALSKLGLFFAQITSTVDQAKARLDGIEAGFEFFSDPSKQTFTPDKIFDQLAAGFDPKTLGFGQLTGGLAALNAQVGLFDAKLQSAVNFEIAGKQASRLTSESIIANPNRKLNVGSGTKEQALEEYLKNVFSQASGGDTLLNDKFEQFVATKFEDVSSGIDSSGNIDATAVNGIIKEFADSLDAGALEQVRRINEINKSFADSYGGLMKQRFDQEREVLDLLKGSVAKQKQVYDLQNKAAGLTGRALSKTEGADAAELDAQTSALNLRNTGLSSDANTDDIRKAIINSQNFQRNGAARQQADNARIASINADPNLSADQKRIAGGQVGLQAGGREKAIEVAEGERQTRLKSELEFRANGTNAAAHAFAELDKALAKAAASSKFMTGALLGTDDQLYDSVRGIHAYNKIQRAKTETEKIAVLATLGQKDRAALGGFVNSADQDTQENFQNGLGFGLGNLAQTPEAKAAIGAAQDQKANQDALASVAGNLLGPINTSIENLKTFYQNQFTSMQNGINQFGQVVQQFQAQVAAIPNVIDHKFNGKVEVNITGADNLLKLGPALKEIVDSEIAVQINNLRSDLAKNNQGLNAKPTVGSASIGGRVTAPKQK